MRRRLNLGCALMSGPRIVLPDEPTVAVDKRSRAHIFDAVRTLRAQGTTILYAHYLEGAENLCYRIAIVDQGQVVACGTLAELLAHSRTTEVIELRLLAPPVTVASVEAIEGVQKVETGAIRIASGVRDAGNPGQINRTVISEHGHDMPTITDWRWDAQERAGARSSSTEGDNA